MSAIEEKAHPGEDEKFGRKSRSIPNQLNEEFYTFSRVIEADAAPTEPQLEVFKLMEQRLDDQLKGWVQIKNDDVRKLMHSSRPRTFRL